MRKRHRMEKEVRAEELSAQAMLGNPAASFTEYTGMAPRIPESEAEADSLCDVCADAPVTSLDGGEAYKKAR
jgi:hypothetical protein